MTYSRNTENTAVQRQSILTSSMNGGLKVISYLWKHKLGLGLFWLMHSILRVESKPSKNLVGTHLDLGTCLPSSSHAVIADLFHSRCYLEDKSAPIIPSPVNMHFIKKNIQLSSEFSVSKKQKQKIIDRMASAFMLARSVSKIDEESIDFALRSPDFKIEIMPSTSSKKGSTKGDVISLGHYNSDTNTLNIRQLDINPTLKNAFAFAQNRLVRTIIHECHHVKVALEYTNYTHPSLVPYAPMMLMPFRNNTEFNQLIYTLNLGLHRLQYINQLLDKDKSNLSTDESRDLTQFAGIAHQYYKPALHDSLVEESQYKTSLKQHLDNNDAVISSRKFTVFEISFIIDIAFLACRKNTDNQHLYQCDILPGSKKQDHINKLRNLYSDIIFRLARCEIGYANENIPTQAMEIHACIREFGSNINSFFFKENEAFENDRHMKFIAKESDQALKM